MRIDLSDGYWILAVPGAITLYAPDGDEIDVQPISLRLALRVAEPEEEAPKHLVVLGDDPQEPDGLVSDDVLLLNDEDQADRYARGLDTLLVDDPEIAARVSDYLADSGARVAYATPILRPPGRPAMHVIDGGLAGCDDDTEEVTR